MSRRERILIKCFFIIVSTIVIFLLFLAGKNISYTAQSSYFDNVRSIASIIFGVTGVWLAITYPKALASAKEAKNASIDTRDVALTTALESSKILIGFVRTMIISIFIIAISLAVPFVKEVFALYQWAIDLKEYFRGALYCILGVVSIVQLMLLGATLKNIYKALTDLHRETAEAATQLERDQNALY